MDQFYPGSVVWASARGDIFWPGRVVEPVSDVTTSAKKCVTINFLVEDSFEDIRNPTKIFAWNCEKQNKFIEKGRGIRNLEKKVQFNKAVAEADDLFTMQPKKEDNMSLPETGEQVSKSPDLKRKEQPIKKKRNSVATRTSPRLKPVDKEKQTSNAENECSRLTADVQPAATNDDNKTKSESTKTKKEKENLKRSHSANGLQTKSNGTDSAKSDVKRRRTLQGQAVNTASAEKKNEISKCIQAQCNGKKAKRKLLDEDEKLKKRLSPKKAKSSHQNCTVQTLENYESVEPFSAKTINVNNENGVEKKESKISSEKNLDFGTEVVDKEADEGVGIDGSASSDVSSDDELLSDAFSPSQEANQFSVGDIVWAKYSREPYWPAQIKKVKGKRKSDRKFGVKFLAWNKGLFSIQPQKLIHFACDADQWAKMMDVKRTLKANLFEPFEKAQIEAEDLLNRKALGRSFNEDLDEDDLEIFEETDSTDQEDVKTEEKELPQETSPMCERRKSSRARKQVSKYNNIISYIRQAKPVLKQILNGTKRSERHQVYCHGRVSEKDQLKHRAGFGPIADGDLRDEVMEMLLRYFKELKGDTDLGYVSDVWIPEAIIYSIQEIDRVDRETAERMYFEGSEVAVTSTEVEELTRKLKGRKFSAEEAEERLRKAERALERYTES